MGKKGKKGKKEEETQETEKVEISEKQFDDIVVGIIRDIGEKAREIDTQMQRFVRMYMDKERDKNYPNTEIVYYAKKGKERSDMGYMVKKAGKIGFVK